MKQPEIKPGKGTHLRFDGLDTIMVFNDHFRNHLLADSCTC